MSSLTTKDPRKLIVC